MVPVRRLSADAARRIALAAQGFDRPRPAGAITRRHLRRVVDTVGVIQIDSVNVLVRSQEMPLFARLGPHPRSLIPAAVAAGDMFEYWSHAASLLRTEDHHLYRWRMAKARAGGGSGGLAQRKQHVVDDVLRQLEARGPLAVGDIEGRVRTKGGTWWDWDETKLALEWLFEIGQVTATRRARDFARLYDLTERVIPPAALARPDTPEPEARRELVRRAARALGVATLSDLANYHGQVVPKVKQLLDELVAAGELVPVEVDGWGKPAFVDPLARTPRRIAGRALLSPFDSLVWHRERIERAFGFDYRIEIYVPAPQRRYGYYVLPFLLDGQLVGRVDLKADRAAGVLRVQAAWVEDDLDNALDRAFVAEHLGDELRDMARWLELPTVGVVRRGTLAADLVRAGLEPVDPRPTDPRRTDPRRTDPRPTDPGPVGA